MFIFDTTDAGCEVDSFWGPAKEEVFMREYPLHRSCRDGNIEELIKLLSQASDVVPYEGVIPRIVFSEDPFYGWTPAHWAAYFGKLDCLRRVTQISRHVDVPNSKFMQTPAHITAFADHPHCLQWLLDIGADPGRKDYLGETPLHKAARSGSVECVTLLISRGARVNVTSSAGQTAGKVAESNGHFQLAQLLEEQLKKSLAPTQHCKPVLQNGNSYSNGYYGYHPSQTQSHCDMVIEDVLLSSEVSHNKISIGGRKRSREVFENQSNPVKRTKMEAFHDKIAMDTTAHSKCMIGYFI